LSYVVRDFIPSVIRSSPSQYLRADKKAVEDLQESDNDDSRRPI